MKDLKHHAFKFQVSQKKPNGEPIEVNPFDPSQFTRPVHLFRKLGHDKVDRGEQSDAASGLDDKEREAREIQRAERQAQKEANQALIAPIGDGGKKPIRRKPQKKVEDVYHDETNPEKHKRARLRYEEARAWHLEDFDGKNKWIGSFEEPISYANVMFEITGSGFNMVPVHKWYKMIRQDRVLTMDAERVERIMQNKTMAPRWLLKNKEPALTKRLVKRADSDDEDVKPAIKSEDYRADVDEIDFDFGGEFDNDDEGLIFGDQADEDAKEIERRLREEFRGANLPGTGVKDEDRDWDLEEQREKEEAELERRRQKKLKKKLMKKEMRREYESDSDDEHPYEESSESETSEDERERDEEERKKEEARKAVEANGGKSGASTKGTNTPTGRLEKKSVAVSLKRDADLSELSGNESSRKKARVNGSIINSSRAVSLDVAKRPSGYGSGSDTDTSRTGTKIKVKASRAGSPHEPPTGSKPASNTNSRAQSPSTLPSAFPTLDEVKRAIPPEGVGISELVRIFKTRLMGRNPDFINLVKLAGKQDPVTKKIVPKD